MPSLHEPLPPALVSQLRAGRVIPFIGAGLSRAVGLPDWKGLLAALTSWAETNGMSAERAALIREDITKQKFLPVAHALRRDLGNSFDEALHNILAPPTAQPTPLHQRLAQVIWPAIITTNFDNLIPSAFPDYKVITWKDQHAIGEVLKSREAHVMMIHGYLDKPDTIVLTPQEYGESSRNPALILYWQTLLAQYSFLFLGVSFSDLDLQSFLERLCATLGQPAAPHFALLPTGRVSAIEIQHFRENYGVETICYSDADNHEELDQFINLAIDQLQPALLCDPSVRLEAIATLQRIRGAMTQDDYIRQLRDVSTRLADDGLIRTARLALAAEYSRAIPSLSSTERIITAVTIAEFQIAEHDIELAYRPLLELLPSLDDTTIELKVRLRLAAILLHLLLSEYCLQEARHVLECIGKLEIQHSFLEQMQSEMVIADYLNGGSIPLGIISDDPWIRVVIAEAYAMQGHISEALLDLATAVSESELKGNSESAAILRIKRAELLFDDHQDKAAWEECLGARHFVGALTPSHQLAFQRNQEFLVLLLRLPQTDAAIARSDIERPTRLSYAQLQRLVEAQESSHQLKLYESLPPLWQELCRNLKTGSWGARRHAHQQFAKEALKANWYEIALHHTLLGANEDLATEFGKAILITQNVDLVDSVVEKLLNRSFLMRHIESTARIITVIADIIPDNRIQAVLDWLLWILAREGETPRTEQLLIKGWKTAQALSFRFSQEQLAVLVAFARSHPYLLGNGWGRGPVLDTITACMGHLDSADWETLATEIVPIATTRRWDGDFDNVLQLLVAIAERSEAAKELIGIALAPPETEVQDLRIAVLTKKLGRSVRPDGITKMAEYVARELPLQIWWGDGEGPRFRLSSGLSQSGIHDGKAIRIEILGGQTDLKFLEVYRSHIVETAWSELVLTVTQLLRHPLNLRVNQIMLIEFLEATADHFSIEQAQAVLLALGSFVDGTSSESPAETVPPKATDRFKVQNVTREQLQAVALRATTTLVREFPNLVNMEYFAALEQSVLSRNSTLRRLACDSIARISEPGRDLEIMLIAATQDEDAHVAATALDGVRQGYEKGQFQPDIDLLIGVARKVATSADSLRRRLAARLASTLNRGTCTFEQKSHLAEILIPAQSDCHFTVRAAAS